MAKLSYKQLSDGIKKILDSHTGKNWLTSDEADILKQSAALFDEAAKPRDPLDNFFNNFFSNIPQESPIIYAEYDDAKNVMTVHRANGDISMFQGVSSNWHKMPMMVQASEPMVRKLNEIHTYVTKWGGPYPNAHVKKQTT